MRPDAAFPLGFPQSRQYLLRLRLASFLLAGITVLAATACGGGGGGGGGGSSAPPTIAPTNSSYRPAAAGDAFTYTGTLTQTFERAALTVTPLPSPNPTSAATVQYAVTQQVSVAATANPSALPSSARSYDFHTVETDVAALETLTTTTDSVLAYVPSGGSTDVEETSTSSLSGDYTADDAQYLTTYGSGNGLIDIIPENGTGQIGTRNSAALTQTETDPDGQITQRSVNANGSYTETVRYADGTNATAVENADGTGSYTFPFLGFETPGGLGTVITVPPPSGTTVTLSVVYPAGLFGTSSVQRQQALTLWYPATPTLSQEQYLNNGAIALPSACSAAVPVLAGRATNELVQTITTVDTVFGEQETNEHATYTATGLGVVCSVLSDVVLQYYDYSGQSYSNQTQTAIYFGSSPVQTTTTTETLAMTQATVLGVTGLTRRTQSVSAQNGYVSDAAFGILLERARARRHRSS